MGLGWEMLGARVNLIGNIQPDQKRLNLTDRVQHLIGNKRMRGRNHERMPLRGEAPKHAPVHQAPQMWRVPVGPGCGAGGRWQGLAGLRDDAPSEARGADGSRAGRRPPAHTAAGPSARNTSGVPNNKNPGT